MEEYKEENIYTLSESADALVDKNIETMDEWMSIMNKDELGAYHIMCDKNPEDRSQEEYYKISKYALVLYCRELGLKTLAVTDELITKITGMFIVNIIIESLRREGYVKTDGPLFLYKNTKINLTEKGKTYFNDIASKDKNQKN